MNEVELMNTAKKKEKKKRSMGSEEWEVKPISTKHKG